jgi:hypothetical protein
MCTVVESFICILLIKTVQMPDAKLPPNDTPENIEKYKFD